MASLTTYTAQFDQEIVTALGIAKPDEYNKLMLAHGDQGLSFFMTMNSLGFARPTTNGTYSHWEEGEFLETIKVKANVADPTAGVDITFALHADSVDNGKYYVRQGDVIMFNNEVTGVVTGIVLNSPDYEVTVKHVIATNNFGALAAGEELSIVSNAFAEGTDQPSGRFTKSFQYTNQTQIIKTANEVTGSEMTNEAWVKVTEDGAKASAYYHRGLVAQEYRHQAFISGALLVNEMSTNTALVDANGRPIRTTGGLIPYMKSTSQLYPKTADTWDVSDYDAMDKLLTKQYAPKYMCIEAGINRHIAMENAAVTYFADTNIDYTRKVMNKELFGDNHSLAASVNFKIFTKSERTYAIQRLHELSNPKLYNHTGLSMVNTALVVPIKRFKDKQGKYASHIGYRWKQLDGYSRKSEVWMEGGAGPARKTNGLDISKTNMRSEIGGQWMKGNQMVYISV